MPLAGMPQGCLRLKTVWILLRSGPRYLAFEPERCWVLLGKIDDVARSLAEYPVGQRYRNSRIVLIIPHDADLPRDQKNRRLSSLYDVSASHDDSPSCRSGGPRW